MEPIDLITIVGLIVGFFLVAIMYVSLKRKKLNAKALPRILGIGTWIYGFVSMMTTSMLLRPLSEFVDYTIENLFWSLALSTVAYFSGRKFARNMPD